MRLLFVAAGTLSLSIGLIGLVVPLLPTTPFLLLAAACYVRGSDRLHRLLLENALVGGLIRDYRAGRGMTVVGKATALALLWGTLAISVLVALADASWVLRAAPAAVGLAVTTHLLMIPTKRA